MKALRDVDVLMSLFKSNVLIYQVKFPNFLYANQRKNVPQIYKSKMHHFDQR